MYVKLPQLGSVVDTKEKEINILTTYTEIHRGGRDVPSFCCFEFLCVSDSDSGYSFVNMTVIVRSYVITKGGVRGRI